jgi:hypothetical protein
VAQRLQNYRPRVAVVAARRKDGPFSADDPGITAPILDADLVLAGPGSPSYAVRQLHGSLAWSRVIARHRLGAGLAFASAAAIAVGSWALPVYEIYKAGHDPEWVAGLGLLEPFGLRLAIVTHWNNAEGGAELDTSRCFIGLERFERLQRELPEEVTVLGIDEHTALVLELDAALASVVGVGKVTVVRCGREESYPDGARIMLSELGPFRMPAPGEGIPAGAWAEALAAHAVQRLAPVPPQEVIDLAAARASARAERRFAEADRLRREIEMLGWQVNDAREGSALARIDEKGSEYGA